MGANWQYKTIADVCSVLTDGNWIESKDQSPEGIRLIQTGNIGNGVFKDKGDKARYISEETFNRLACTEIFEGDVLVSRLPEPIGRSCILPKLNQRTITAVDCSILRFKDTLLNKFFVYYTLSPAYNRTLKNYITGSSRKRISRSNLSSVNIPVPPMEEQQKIVSELDLLAGIVDKKNAQLHDLDSLSRSIFYEMFGDPVINERKWPVKTLNSVCDVRDGTHDSPKYLLQSDYILITSKNINGDSIDFSNINYISKDDYDAINRRSKVDEGDIIMAMIGTIGKPVIVKDTGYKFCVKNVALIKFPVQSEVSNIYIRALLNSPSYSDYIMSLNKGGTQKFVPLGTLRGLPIPVPSATALQEFAERLSIVESQSKLIRQSILELNKLLDSRMNHYFV